MECTNKDFNRLEAVLAEKKCANKWLVEQFGKDSGTASE